MSESGTIKEWSLMGSFRSFGHDLEEHNRNLASAYVLFYSEDDIR